MMSGVISLNSLELRDGDLWQLGDHRLLCGDSTVETNIAAAMDGREARLTVTSPPYGVGKEYEKKGVKTWRALVAGVISAIKDHTRVIAWNIGDLYCTGNQFIEPTSMYTTQMMDAAGFGMLYTRIWRKPCPNFHKGNPYFLSTMKPVQEYEFILGYARRDYEKDYTPVQQALRKEADKAGLNNAVLKTITGAGYMYGHWFTRHQWSMMNRETYEKIQAYCRENGIDAFTQDYDTVRAPYDAANIFQKTLTDDDRRTWGLRAVWDIKPVDAHGDHPAAFPVELPLRLIKLHTRPGDTVLDPFGGSGTTMIAAEELGHCAVLVEKDPAYCAMAIRRWEQQTGRRAEFLRNIRK